MYAPELRNVSLIPMTILPFNMDVAAPVSLT